MSQTIEQSIVQQPGTKSKREKAGENTLLLFPYGLFISAIRRPANQITVL
jgi:hypothetical protein